MPRVSEAHLIARRQQILDAARSCFLRDGFHATSMQDVIKEAGLSVGAVYRYFPSKQALIRAIAERALGMILDTLDQIAGSGPPAPLSEVLNEVLAIVDAETGERGGLRIAVQVWGEAQRDPKLAAMVGDIYGDYRRRCRRLIERAVRAGQLPAETEPDRVAAALLGLAVGYGVQRLLLGDLVRDSYLLGIGDLAAGSAFRDRSEPGGSGEVPRALDDLQDEVERL